MNCKDLREHYELYEMGLAEDPERSEIRAHVNRGCEVCMKGMRSAREMLAARAESLGTLRAGQVAKTKAKGESESRWRRDT